MGGACAELHHSAKNLRTAWSETLLMIYWDLKKNTGWIFYHYRVVVHRLARHISVQKVNLASDDPFNRTKQQQQKKQKSFFTWFIIELLRPKRLSGKRNLLLLLPSSDSDLTNFSLSPFSLSCSFCRHFFLRLRRSLALLELSLDISDELQDKFSHPSPSSSTTSSDTVPADVAIALACSHKINHSSNLFWL